MGDGLFYYSNYLTRLNLKRKDFIQMAGLGLTSFVLPKMPFGSRLIDPSEALNEGMDVGTKKKLADAALNAAKSKGATYADVRIGRYLNQFVVTREVRVQNIANAESFGVGIRVIANGSWGFAATNDVTPAGVARTAEKAVAVARPIQRSSPSLCSWLPKKAMGK